MQKNVRRLKRRRLKRRRRMRANGFEYLLMVDALRDVLYGGTHEGYTKIAVGVRARLPFRVLTMTDPGRVVIDVAHRW